MSNTQRFSPAPPAPGSAPVPAPKRAAKKGPPVPSGVFDPPSSPQATAELCADFSDIERHFLESGDAPPQDLSAESGERSTPQEPSEAGSFDPGRFSEIQLPPGLRGDLIEAKKSSQVQDERLRDTAPAKRAVVVVRKSQLHEPVSIPVKPLFGSAPVQAPPPQEAPSSPVAQPLLAAEVPPAASNWRGALESLHAGALGRWSRSTRVGVAGLAIAAAFVLGFVVSRPRIEPQVYAASPGMERVAAAPAARIIATTVAATKSSHVAVAEAVPAAAPAGVTSSSAVPSPPSSARAGTERSSHAPAGLNASRLSNKPELPPRKASWLDKPIAPPED